MPAKEIQINSETLNDLVAEWMYKMGYVRYSEDIHVIAVSGGVINGNRTVTYKIEPKKEIIFHD